jgi:hypothetical protein
VAAIGITRFHIGRVDAGTIELVKSFGCTVIAVHHTGRDEDRERGSTALRGAADTMIRVKLEDGNVTVSCEKQKDALAFSPLRFRLESAAQSCVLVPIGDAAEPGAEVWRPLVHDCRTAGL